MICDRCANPSVGAFQMPSEHLMAADHAAVIAMITQFQVIEHQFQQPVGFPTTP